ncbi:oligo-1,6-glucosidase [Janthinobacterium lividum]|nr:oligo-1,6-glucosidase [Janthinobacterium lividum]
MVYGKYLPLLEQHPQVFAYRRSLGSQQLVVVNNFSGEHVELDLPAMLHGIVGQGLISNYAQRDSWTDHLSLQPYESFAIAYECEAERG